MSVSTAASKGDEKQQLTREEVHTYTKAMLVAMETPEFSLRVREAMSRVPVPRNAEEMMYRYEEVQADYFTNHYNPAAVPTDKKKDESEEQKLAAQVDAMTVDAAPASEPQAEKLDGDFIMEQLRSAVSVYRDSETERVITQLCLLVEAKVMALPATVPALKHLSAESMHGQDPASAVAAARANGNNAMPMIDPSPQMVSMMEMAMKTLTPQQRTILERAQRTMMSGNPPSPDDMREMFLIQRQIGAFMQTMQQFGQLPGGRGNGRGGRGGRGGGRGGRGK